MTRLQRPEPFRGARTLLKSYYQGAESSEETYLLPKRQSKKGRNTLVSLHPALCSPAWASHWLSLPGSQGAKEPGKCSSLCYGAEQMADRGTDVRAGRPTVLIATVSLSSAYYLIGRCRYCCLPENRRNAAVFFCKAGSSSALKRSLKSHWSTAAPSWPLSGQCVSRNPPRVVCLAPVWPRGSG